MQNGSIDAPAASRTVTSKDGTEIAYTTVGSGPSVILIPGVLSVAEDYAAFADALGAHFTVHTIERRGRGLSGAQGERYDIDREVEDVSALCTRTGARYLVGHSYGGLIALQAARNNPTLAKIAVYEPGVSVDGLIPTSWMPKYAQLVAEGKPLDALAWFSAATGPDRARTTPMWMMKPILRLAIRSERRHQMFDLLTANLLEHQQVARLNDTDGNYREVSAPVLLMSGGKNKLRYVAPAMRRLTQTLPASATRVFPKLDHFGPERTGPSEVAQAVDEFLRS